MRMFGCLALIASLLAATSAVADGPNPTCDRFRGETIDELGVTNVKFQAVVAELTDEERDFFRRVSEVEAGARLIQAELAGRNLQIALVVTEGALGLCDAIGQ